MLSVMALATRQGSLLLKIGIKMKSLLIKTAVLLLSVVAGSVHAEYPERPVSIIVPYAPGGTVDIVARVIAEPLAKTFGVPVVVENRAGAAGMIGTQYVANSKADGYTLLLNSSVHIIAPHLYPNINYDALNDLQPVSMISSVPLVLVAAPSVPFKSVEEMIAWGKAQPNGISYGSSSTGSGAHIAGELFAKKAGVDMMHIPYKGSSAAVVDVMGGQVPIMFDALTGIVSHIKSGKLRALAVTGDKRSAVIPDVPTFAELGFEDFDLGSWNGVWAPKNTPKSVVEKLSKEIVRISHTPEVEKRIQDLAAQIVGSGSTEFDAYSRSEYKKWGDMVESLNIKLE